MNIGVKFQWLLRVTAGAALLLIAAGCETEKTDGVAIAHGEKFLPNDVDRPLYQFNTMQASNAAHLDATLRAYHFDGIALNSLGEERLDLILRNGDTPTPLVVYLDIPADDARTATRQKVVTAFLKDRGLAEDQIQLKSGPNPDVNTFVGPLLAGQAAAASSGGAAAAGAPASGAGGK